MFVPYPTEGKIAHLSLLQQLSPCIASLLMLLLCSVPQVHAHLLVVVLRCCCCCRLHSRYVLNCTALVRLQILPFQQHSRQQTTAVLLVMGADCCCGNHCSKAAAVDGLGTVMSPVLLLCCCLIFQSSSTARMHGNNALVAIFV
jgi:hypothetical protein